jgi:hypothetical protein
MNEQGLWQELIQNKNLHSKTLSQVTAKPTDSPFWKGLMKVKEEFFARGKFKVGNGANTRFWEDTWLGDKPLSMQYPSLYGIVQRKQVTVATVLGHNSLNIAFRRNLTGDKWTQWLNLVSRLMEVQLSSDQDFFRWNLTASGEFSVKSMYLDFMNGHTIFLKRYIWKIKVPLKIRIFMWFLHRKVILTKDNLLKWNWQGNSSCVFCDKDESIKHLFFECPLAKIIWRVVHMTFGIPSPRNVSNMFGNWLTGLNKQEVKNIRIGACAIVWAL